MADKKKADRMAIVGPSGKRFFVETWVPPDTSAYELEKTLKKAEELGLGRIVSKWLSDPEKRECASKSYDSFTRVVETCVGYLKTDLLGRQHFQRHADAEKIAKLVFCRVLSSHKKAGLAARDWFQFANVAAYATEYKVADAVFGWLSDDFNMEHAAKDWLGFSGLVLSTTRFLAEPDQDFGDTEIAEVVFRKCLSRKETTCVASENWRSFADLVKSARKGRSAKAREAMLTGLSDPDLLREALKNQEGFAKVIEYCIEEPEMVPFVFKHLSVKKSRDAAAKDWFVFAGKLYDGRNLGEILRYPPGVYAWFGKNGVELMEEEKRNLALLLENRRRLGKSPKKSAEALLKALPKLRNTLRGLRDTEARSFVLKHAMFYTGVSEAEPEKFREFVDELDSSKKRIAELKKLGVDTAFWNNYKDKEHVSIAGKKARQVALEEVLSAAAHFGKCMQTGTEGLEGLAKKLKEGTDKRLEAKYAILKQALLVQEYAKRKALPALQEGNKQEYLGIVAGYYAEQDNWKELPDYLTKEYARIEKGIQELLERFGQKQAEIDLGIITWERKLPDDIFIANVCGDCTCTSGKFAEAGSTRLADNGYSILKICIIEGKKARHIGNIYCMAYAADGDSCLALDGIEVTQSFEYGSPEVAEALLGFARKYAHACRFKAIVLNSYPSNIGWIKGYVERNYAKTKVKLSKIGGNSHLAELGLKEAKVLAEGMVGVYVIAPAGEA